jgi:hypothetical protein
MAATSTLSSLVVGCPVAPARQSSISSTSSSKASPWRPDSAALRGRPLAASRRTLLQQLAVSEALRPSRLAAATVQAPSVSFLPPSTGRTARAEEIRTAVPKQHNGPPVFVQATGRIIASKPKRPLITQPVCCSLVACRCPTLPLPGKRAHKVDVSSGCFRLSGAAVSALP